MSDYMRPATDEELIESGLLKVDTNGNPLYRKLFYDYRDIELFYAYDVQNRVVKETMVSCTKGTIIADKSYDDLGYVTTNSTNMLISGEVVKSTTKSFNNRDVYFKSGEEEYFTFGHALELMYSGKKVARKAYGGYSYVKQVVVVNSIEDAGIDYTRVFQLMKTSDNSIKNDNWKIPTEDILASDWILVDEDDKDGKNI